MNQRPLPYPPFPMAQHALRQESVLDSGVLGSEFSPDLAARLRRRVDRFRRLGMLSPRDADVVIKRARTSAELRGAYRLVHDVFVSQKYILPQPGGLRLRPFEALPEMATFVALRQDQVIGVMSIVQDSKEFGLPSDHIFHDELATLKAQGRRVGEITNLAVAPEARKSSVFFDLAQCISAHAEKARLDDLFVAVSPGHGTFFECILGFAPFGGPRVYCPQTEDVVEGKRQDRWHYRQRLQDIDRHLGSDAFVYSWFVLQNPHLREMPRDDEYRLDTQVLREILAAGHFFCHTEPRQHEAIRNKWGRDVFDQVYHRCPGECAISARHLSHGHAGPGSVARAYAGHGPPTIRAGHGHQ